MSVYLSKKLSMRNDTTIRCVSINITDRYIAAGGDEGFLKIFSLENQNKDDNTVGRCIATANSLIHDQLLEGHKASIGVLAWNEKFRKLTSGDLNGNIIVWIIDKTTWCEEMVNTRNKSLVKDIRWTPDGQKICIVYDDGEVITGSVNGNKIWGLSLKNIKLTCVSWSPDGNVLLFGVNDSEVHVYDCHGNFMKKLPNFMLNSKQSKNSTSTLVTIDWFHSACFTAKQTSLAVGYKDGTCVLFKNNDDDDPCILSSGLKLITCKWNDDGSLLGVLGSVQDSEHYLHFYQPSGEMVTSMKLPGKVVGSFSWDSGSVRLVIGVDSFVYFANYRLNYMYSKMSNSIVFSYKYVHDEHDTLCYWNTSRDQKVLKVQKNLVGLMGSDDFCCIITRPSSEEDESDMMIGLNGYNLILTNSIGTTFDNKYVDMQIKYSSMSNSHVIVASSSAFFVWQFKNLKNFATLEIGARNKGGIEKLLHIDDVASGVGGDNIDWKRASEPTNDEISCLTISKNLLIVARASGMLHMYNLPNLMLQFKHATNVTPSQVILNYDLSYLAIIAENNNLLLYKMKGEDNNEMILMDDIKKKDVWSFKWAMDDPTSFVVMEKTKMQIFNNFEPEEAVMTSAYPCSFNYLTITSVYLDDVMDMCRHSNDIISSSFIQFIGHYETKSLKDLRSILMSKGYESALKFADEHPHNKLWMILGEYQLNQLDLKGAEMCYARASYYAGIQFIKKLATMQNNHIKQAEVATFFSKFEEAEQIYLSIDRKDLVVAMYDKMGNYGKVVELMGGGGDWLKGDQGKNEVFNKLADHYADKQMWPNALDYYTEGQNETKQIECCHMLQDYDALNNALNNLPDNHDVLPELGRQLTMLGMCKEAVQAYLKCNMVSQAIDACTYLNQWSLAIDLGHAHNRPDVDSLLLKYLKVVMEKEKLLEVVLLYCKANHHLEAAKILFKMAEESNIKLSNPLLMKKLYLLSALLVEEHHQANKKAFKSKVKKNNDEVNMALTELLIDDSSSRVTTDAWRSVEAYHYYLLALRQFYKGNFESCMITCLHLKEFDDIINPEELYSLLALSSYSCKNFSVCSDAFMRLESAKDLSESQRREYEELAIELFYRNNLKDQNIKKVKCSGCHVEISHIEPSCPHCNTKFLSCVATGKFITSYEAWCCSCCKRCAYTKEIAKYKACPMCHQSF